MTINYDGDEPTVSARELHKALDVQSRWFSKNHTHDKS